MFTIDHPCLPQCQPVLGPTLAPTLCPMPCQPEHPLASRPWLASQSKHQAETACLGHNPPSTATPCPALEPCQPLDHTHRPCQASLSACRERARAPASTLAH